MMFQIFAIERAAGPAGSRADNSPVQACRARAATAHAVRPRIAGRPARKPSVRFDGPDARGLGYGFCCFVAATTHVSQGGSMEKLAKPLPKGTGTAVAIKRHPLHPMLVTFPIALLVCGLASDIAYLFFSDEFWARMSLWLLGVGTFMGILAGTTGTIELLAVAGIRRRAAAWNHFVMGTMLLAVSFTNWLWRVPDAAAAILPLGIYLSFISVLLVTVTGWMGGKLVFDEEVGIHS